MPAWNASRQILSMSALAGLIACSHLPVPPTTGPIPVHANATAGFAYVDMDIAA